MMDLCVGSASILIRRRGKVSRGVLVLVVVPVLVVFVEAEAEAEAELEAVGEEALPFFWVGSLGALPRPFDDLLALALALVFVWSLLLTPVAVPVSPVAHALGISPAACPSLLAAAD